MKDKNNQCQYTHQQLIDADRYAYNMSGSSPCEDCKNNRFSNLYLNFLCQDECEDLSIFYRDGDIVNFAVEFYNGGTCLQEILEDNL